MPENVSALTPLATITLTGTQSTVTFSSISGSYRDLILVGSNILSSTNNDAMSVRLNTDSGSNYSYISGRGDGGNASYSNEQNVAQSQHSPVMIPSTTGPADFVIHFLDYAQTDKHKTFISRANTPDATFRGAGMTVNRWASTSAITTITLRFNSAATYAVGSTFSLYGVSA